MTVLISSSLASARPCADPDVEAVDQLVKGVRTFRLVMCALRAECATNPDLPAAEVLRRLAEALHNIPTIEEAPR